MNAGRLELRRTPEGLRYFLANRPVPQGALLELLLEGDLWIAGRFEWNGVEVRWPAFRVDLGVMPGEERTNGLGAPTGVLPLSPRAVLRWP